MRQHAQTKREQAAATVNEILRKVLYPSA